MKRKRQKFRKKKHCYNFALKKECLRRTTEILYICLHGREKNGVILFPGEILCMMHEDLCSIV